MRGSLLLVLALLASAHAGPDQRTLKAVRAAIARLKSSDPETRVRGAHELGRYGAAAKGAVPYLAKALCDREDWRVRSVSRESLAKIGEAAVPGLVKALKDRDPNVRIAILETLCEVKLLRHLEPQGKKLTLMFRDKDERVVRAAIGLFVTWGSPAVDPLLPALGVSRPEARAAAVAALAGAAANAPDQLATALGEQKSARVQGGLCVALGRVDLLGRWLE